MTPDPPLLPDSTDPKRRAEGIAVLASAARSTSADVDFMLAYQWIASRLVSLPIASEEFERRDSHRIGDESQIRPGATGYPMLLPGPRFDPDAGVLIPARIQATSSGGQRACRPNGGGAHSATRSGRYRASQAERGSSGRRSWGKHRCLSNSAQSGICPKACRKFLILDCPCLFVSDS